MTQHALYVQLEAKPGKEQEVANFLSGARNMITDEPETTAWFAIRMGPRSFGIFDAFANEHGRDAHLQGKLAARSGRRLRICSSGRRRSSGWKCSRTNCLTKPSVGAPSQGRAAEMSAAGVSAALSILNGKAPRWPRLR